MRRHFRADRFGLWVAALLAASLAVQSAQAQVQINGLSDLSFGALPVTGADQTKTESVCTTSGLLGGGYGVTVNGSGTGGAFTLANGSAALPYEVQWAQTGGQTSGHAMTAGTKLGGQSTGLLNCALGGNATVIVIIRGTQIMQATAGNYNGTLTIILSSN